VTVVGDVRDALAGDLAPSGVLRAAINLGNPVVAQGPAAPSTGTESTGTEPTGVAVDIARELGARLAVPVELACFSAARKSLAALQAGDADICFLAIEPARAAHVAFTAPYVLIEGVFVVPEDSSITTVADVDREHVRVGVNQESAYDLFLSRTLKHAALVRGENGIALFRTQGLDAGAGIRQPVSEFVASHPGFRLIDERFMQIRQALGTTRTRTPATIEFLAATIEELKASGFIADALRRSGQDPALVAPPAETPPAETVPAETLPEGA
jgi:polar amino acid transport system substrate-binding protein